MNNKTMTEYDFFMSGEELDSKQSLSSLMIFLLTLNF